jgi:hypothetical protein
MMNNRTCRLAEAFIASEEAISKLRNAALVSDIISACTVGIRGDAGACVLDAEKADALEYCLNTFSALALDLHRSYAAHLGSAA